MVRLRTAGRAADAPARRGVVGTLGGLLEERGRVFGGVEADRGRAGRAPRRGSWWGAGGEAEGGQDLVGGVGVFEGGNELHAAVAAWAAQGVEAKGPFHERGPVETTLARGVVGVLGMARAAGYGRRRRGGAGGSRGGAGGGVAQTAAGEGETSSGVRGQEARIANHMKASRRHQGTEAKEELLGLETEPLTTLGVSAFH